jgi:hypothetical protein
MTAREILFYKRGATLAVILGLAMPATAKAVDLENRDRAPRKVVVNGADGSSQSITVKAGELVKDICSDCVILLGDSSVETRGRATVKIEDGKVSIVVQR